MTDNHEYFVIWSYEHNAWWGPGRWGYTDDFNKAGHYTKREADEIVAHANLVAVNEVALPFNGTRFHVVPEHNQHAGDGWTLFDVDEQRLTGGWFADRVAAEQTATVLNGDTHASASPTH